MDNILLNDLTLNETDVTGALERLSGDTEVYLTVLSAFPSDTSMTTLSDSVGSRSWDAAFTAAHALKGLAGNLGFTQLFYSLSELVILIRGAKVADIDKAFEDVRRNYNDIVRIICNHCK